MSKAIIAGVAAGLAGLLLGAKVAHAREAAPQVPQYLKDILKDFSVYYIDTYEDPPVEWGPRIVDLDAWYTKVINYTPYSAHHGIVDIITVGIEDLPNPERADDWTDMILRVQLEPRLTTIMFKGSIDKVVYYKGRELYHYKGQGYRYENRIYDCYFDEETQTNRAYTPYAVFIDVPD